MVSFVYAEFRKGGVEGFPIRVQSGFSKKKCSRNP